MNDGVPRGHRDQGIAALGPAVRWRIALPRGNRKRTPARAASTPVDRSPIPARDDPSPGVGRRTGGSVAMRRIAKAYQSDVEDE